jgi:hypothetical protein
MESNIVKNMKNCANNLNNLGINLCISFIYIVISSSTTLDIWHEYHHDYIYSKNYINLYLKYKQLSKHNNNAPLYKHRTPN